MNKKNVKKFWIITPVVFVSVLVLLGTIAVVNVQGEDDGNKGINSAKVPEGIEKYFADNSRGGEGILKNILMTFDGEYGNTKFEVDISESGKYYMTAWVMDISGQDKIQAYPDDEANQAIGGLTLEESMERGLTIFEKVELSEDETAKQLNLIENIPEEVKQEFNIKYEAWKETWDDPNLTYASNPRMFTQSRQYKEFLSFCKEQDKTIWPLLFQKYEQGDKHVAETIIDLTYYNEYGFLLDEIRQEKEQYNAKGAYIAPSDKANMMKYIKKLLALI